jgi:hypothetical protein
MGAVPEIPLRSQAKLLLAAGSTVAPIVDLDFPRKQEWAGNSQPSSTENLS